MEPAFPRHATCAVHYLPAQGASEPRNPEHWEAWCGAVNNPLSPFGLRRARLQPVSQPLADVSPTIMQRPRRRTACFGPTLSVQRGADELQRYAPSPSQKRVEALPTTNNGTLPARCLSNGGRGRKKENTAEMLGRVLRQWTSSVWQAVGAIQPTAAMENGTESVNASTPPPRAFPIRPVDPFLAFPSFERCAVALHPNSAAQGRASRPPAPLAQGSNRHIVGGVPRELQRAQQQPLRAPRYLTVATDVRPQVVYSRAPDPQGGPTSKRLTQLGVSAVGVAVAPQFMTATTASVARTQSSDPRVNGPLRGVTRRQLFAAAGPPERVGRVKTQVQKGGQKTTTPPCCSIPSGGGPEKRAPTATGTLGQRRTPIGGAAVRTKAVASNSVSKRSELGRRSEQRALPPLIAPKTKTRVQPSNKGAAHTALPKRCTAASCVKSRTKPAISLVPVAVATPPDRELTRTDSESSTVGSTHRAAADSSEDGSRSEGIEAPLSVDLSEAELGEKCVTALNRFVLQKHEQVRGHQVHGPRAKRIMRQFETAQLFGAEHAPSALRAVMTRVSRFTCERTCDVSSGIISGVGKVELQTQLVSQALCPSPPPTDLFDVYRLPTSDITSRLHRLLDKKKLQNTARRVLEHLLFAEALEDCHGGDVSTSWQTVLLASSTTHRREVLDRIFSRIVKEMQDDKRFPTTAAASWRLSLNNIRLFLDSQGLWPREIDVAEHTHVLRMLAASELSFHSGILSNNAVSREAFTTFFMALPYNLPDFILPKETRRSCDRAGGQDEPAELELVLRICDCLLDVETTAEAKSLQEARIESALSETQGLWEVGEVLQRLQESGYGNVGMPPRYFRQQDIFLSSLITLEEIQTLLLLGEETWNRPGRQELETRMSDSSAVASATARLLGVCCNVLSDEEWAFVDMPFDPTTTVPVPEVLAQRFCVESVEGEGEAAPLVGGADERDVRAAEARPHATEEEEEASNAMQPPPRTFSAESPRFVPQLHWSSCLVDEDEHDAPREPLGELLGGSVLPLTVSPAPVSRLFGRILPPEEATGIFWRQKVASDADRGVIETFLAAGDGGGLAPLDVTSFQVCCVVARAVLTQRVGRSAGRMGWPQKASVPADSPGFPRIGVGAHQQLPPWIKSVQSRASSPERRRVSL